MNPEELFEKLIKNKISREEFEQLFDGLEDEDILARYEIYLQSQFEKEVEKHFQEKEHESDDKISKLRVTKKYSTKKNKKWGKDNYPLAAILALFIGLLFSVLFIVSQSDFTSEQATVAKATINPEIISKSTPRGRKFRMMLDDGSFVHMNSVSNIIYPNKFDSESRDIEIRGEAYFDIKRDETRPFNIKVKEYSIQVLGTSFNIQAYDDEDEFSVTVESGKVKIMLDEEGSNFTMLEKGQKLVFNPKTNVTEIMEVFSEDDLSWRKGILKFDSTPLSEVEKILERWYGIDMIIEGKKLSETPITGIHKNKSIKSVVEALTYATRTKYIIKNNSIIIKN